jgi:phosphatidate cytidylyltransferase
MMTEQSKTSLFNRVLISVIGIPAILGLIYAGGLWFTTFISIAVILCTYEFLTLFKIPSKAGIFFFTLLNGGLVYLVYYHRTDLILMMILAGWTVAALVTMLLYSLDHYYKSFLIVSSMIYPGLALSTLVMIRGISVYTGWELFLGAKILYYILAMIWICDTLAYFFGSAYGSVKFSPTVSPNKTWEGAIAGFLGALFVALAAFLYGWIPVFHAGDYLILALFAGVFGQLGDLVESALKRHIGVKDTSRLLLDHGGALDRLDSLAFTGPLVYFYLILRFL